MPRLSVVGLNILISLISLSPRSSILPPLDGYPRNHPRDQNARTKRIGLGLVSAPGVSICPVCQSWLALIRWWCDGARNHNQGAMWLATADQRETPLTFLRFIPSLCLLRPDYFAATMYVPSYVCTHSGIHLWRHCLRSDLHSGGWISLRKGLYCIPQSTSLTIWV